MFPNAWMIDSKNMCIVFFFIREFSPSDILFNVIITVGKFIYWILSLCAEI